MKKREEITADHIAHMEGEMGEWIVDCVDFSMYMNKPEVKARYYDLIGKAYPELVITKEEMEESDITEVLNDRFGADEMGEDDYYKYNAFVYNIDPGVWKGFWEYWDECDFKL